MSGAASARPPIVTFLTDYGVDDPFVGLCHAAVLAIEPRARIIDLCHQVPPQNVHTGALLLADCMPYLPPAVHVAVVDPGVGTARRGIAIQAGDHLLVGPDNGLLWPAALRAGGVDGAWHLAEAAYHGRTVSRTFHGRDVFAPVAGHLAAGLPPQQLGPALDPRELVHIGLPTATVGDRHISCQVTLIDRFGNVQLSTTGRDLAVAGFAAGTELQVTIDGRDVTARLVETFASVPVGAFGLVEDSFGRATIFSNARDAAKRLGIAVGASVELRREPGP